MGLGDATLINALIRRGVQQWDVLLGGGAQLEMGFWAAWVSLPASPLLCLSLLQSAVIWAVFCLQTCNHAQAADHWPRPLKWLTKINLSSFKLQVLNITLMWKWLRYLCFAFILLTKTCSYVNTLSHVWGSWCLYTLCGAVYPSQPHCVSIHFPFSSSSFLHYIPL